MSGMEVLSTIALLGNLVKFNNLVQISNKRLDGDAKSRIEAKIKCVQEKTDAVSKQPSDELSTVVRSLEELETAINQLEESVKEIPRTKTQRKVSKFGLVWHAKKENAALDREQDRLQVVRDSVLLLSQALVTKLKADSSAFERDRIDRELRHRYYWYAEAPIRDSHCFNKLTR
jgi:hypothetical protein